MVAFASSSVLTASDLNDAFNRLTINEQTGTTYTLILSDEGGLVTVSNASPITVTVPANATVAYGVGTVITILNVGSSLATVAGASGVTITPSTGTSLAGNESAALIKIDTNTWQFVRGGFPKAVVASSTAAATESVTVGAFTATVYKFTGTGSITFTQGGLVDVLLVGPGGSGGDSGGGAAGAGGAGGFVTKLGLYVDNGAENVIIGAGMANSFSVTGNNSVSTFAGVTAIGGGNGGPYRDRMPSGGACGGGSAAFAVSTARGSNYQGLIGANLRGGNGRNQASGGGGGVAGDAPSTSGGSGTAISSDWGSGYGTVGRGGGGTPMTANTGNGGNVNSSGNSGLVLVRVYD